MIELNRRLLLLSFNSTKKNYLGLLACGALFLCGCIAGTVSAGCIDEGTMLNDYITGFLSIFTNDTSPKLSLFSSLANNFKYQLIALFLGFSVIGVFLLPILSAVRGFFLSFSVAAIIRLLGSKGILLTLALFGVNTLITVPCFYYIRLGILRFAVPLRLVFSKTLKIRFLRSAAGFYKLRYMPHYADHIGPDRYVSVALSDSATPLLIFNRRYKTCLILRI